MSDNSEKKNTTGWECPRCGSVNAPQKDKCQCPPKKAVNEGQNDSRQLLQETKDYWMPRGNI